MKTPLAGLAIAALLLGAGGCESGGEKACQTAANSIQPDDGVVSFGVFGLDSTGAQRYFPSQLAPNRPGGAFAPAGTIVAEKRDFTFSNSHQILEITDSRPTPTVAGRSILGCANFVYLNGQSATISVSRDFSGQLGTFDNSAAGGYRANPEISVNSGWAYVELESGYSTVGATGYRPIVRTKRVIAMSQGTSMLIFNDPTENIDGTPGGEEYIINRANAGRNIVVSLNNNSTRVDVPPGQFIRVYGSEITPEATTPAAWGGLPPTSKLKSFMLYAKRARDAAYNKDTGE